MGGILKLLNETIYFGSTFLSYPTYLKCCQFIWETDCCICQLRLTWNVTALFYCFHVTECEKLRTEKTEADSQVSYYYFFFIFFYFLICYFSRLWPVAHTEPAACVLCGICSSVRQQFCPQFLIHRTFVLVHYFCNYFLFAITYTGCLQLLEILEISWNLLDLLEIFV